MEPESETGSRSLSDSYLEMGDVCLGRRQRADRSPVVVMFPDKARTAPVAAPTAKQNQNCPCRRASSRRKPWSRFALGLLFPWFETSFDPIQVPIECDHLRS